MHTDSPRRLVTAALVALAFSRGFAVRGVAAARPCPPSGVRLAGASQPLDRTPPTIALISPAAGVTVSGSVAVSACAADGGGIAGVQFKVDGANLGVENTAGPYSVAWDTRSVTNGSHTLSAAARDRAGNVATSAGIAVTVANATAPSVSITSPAANTRASGSIAVTATVSAGTVGVQFLLDGANLGAEDVTAPFAATLDTRMLVDGTHTVGAIARDSSAATARAAAVSFTTANGVVRLSPADTSLNVDTTNYVFRGRLITLNRARTASLCFTALGGLSLCGCTSGRGMGPSSASRSSDGPLS